MADKIKLTQYSHGAGCGCKISPSILSSILKHNEVLSGQFPHLIVGNAERDDAAVLDLGHGQSLISTTDFFMPIVDDPFDFGRIAATNAISDVYAMGGKPILAIAILGWPINTLDPELAGEVLRGGRHVCQLAGIPLAGGHSIDAPEPIFGLAVNGLVPTMCIKQNSHAKAGDVLFLTKHLGVGIITTAEKRQLATDADVAVAIDSMTTLNNIGEALGMHPAVHALTDVTGFGLLGHLSEICTGSKLTAEIEYESIPIFEAVEKYVQLKAVPGGTMRNWQSCMEQTHLRDASMISILCDPQTSGGLLIAMDPSFVNSYQELAQNYGLSSAAFKPIGRLVPPKEKLIYVV